MTEIIVDRVGFSYRSRRQIIRAVNDVSFRAKSGKVYALVGRSGSGKSTLLSLLAGLNKPDCGSIMINGSNLQSMNPDLYRRKQVSVIYQNYSLFPLLTVKENLLYPLLLNKVDKAEDETQTLQKLRVRFPDAILISAKDETGFIDLKARIFELLYGDN